MCTAQGSDAAVVGVVRARQTGSLRALWSRETEIGVKLNAVNTTFADSREHCLVRSTGTEKEKLFLKIVYY